MNKLEYMAVNETVYHETLDNGLNVYMLKKEGFHKTYATFTTNLGSLNTKIIKDDEILELPEGIAHFLEHKLFEQDGEDVTSLFAMNQASVNAYTQNNQTTYLFSCTDNFFTNLELLLKFVQFPKFTTEGIKKEIGIITQEINMYKDNPSSSIYMRLLNNMYKSHPVKNEILGTVETISTINKELLETTHSTFYSPKNMMLFISGNIDIDKTIDLLRKNQENVSIDSAYEIPPLQTCHKTIFVEHSDMEQEIKVPNYLMGIKMPAIKKEEIIKLDMTFSVLLDLYMGRSSENLKDLLKNNLINDTFSMDHVLTDTYSYYLVGSETNYPQKLQERLQYIFTNIEDFEVTESMLLKTKKQTIGGFVQALNSIEYIANNYTKFYYNDASLFDLLNISKSITVKDVKDAMKYFKNKECYTSVTMNPKKR